MTPAWFSRVLVEGDTGHDVLIVQRKLGVPMTGVMDNTTQAAVRGLQRNHRLEQTGAVDADLSEVLGEKASAGTPPQWFVRTSRVGDEGMDVLSLALALGTPPEPVFTPALEVALLRFQASVGLPTTGVLDLGTAVAVADRTV